MMEYKSSFYRKWAIYLAIAVFPIIECIQGFIFQGDTSKAFTNILAALLIIAFFLLAPSSFSLKNTHSVLLAVLVSIFLLLTSSKGVISGNLQYDFFAILRSIILGFATYSIAYAIPDQKKIKILQNSAIYAWLFVTLSIILSGLSGIGLYTYEEFSAGHKFYFPSINELTFFYIASFIVIYTLSSSTLQKYATTLGTIICFSIIGNKAFIPLLALAFSLLIFFNSSRLTRYIYAGLLLLIPLIFIAADLQYDIISTITDGIVLILSKYSSGAEKFSTKLSYLNLFSALISERDMLVGIAIDLYQKCYDSIDTIIGLNLSEYGKVYGLKRGTYFSFSENDVVDIFMSYGLLGLVIFTLIATKLYRKESVTLSTASLKKTLIILFVASGALTGHIYLFGLTCFVFSLYCGLLSRRQAKAALPQTNEN
ncbi:hypothetical protein VV867_24450 [Pseudomonas sp. JH-2]|uniref:hypothetical protein n=1 Tax=Pseudomonas sp. JH-2 TaxID=3114998 RepID=UPI002E253B98|nr:hypothetical protein [Pseudomonas sp. JH-2]